MKKTEDCKKHGPYECETSDIGGFTFCTTCPRCEAELAEVEALKAASKDKAAFERRMAAMNIEPAYFGATIENYQAETPEQQKAKATVQKLVQGEISKIVMTGTNGTGKTHLACAAVHALGGKILTMYEISTAIRACYTTLAQKTEIQAVSELANLPMLVIDEIGRTKGSEVEANWLSYIIDKRHVRFLPLILISNKHTKKDCTKTGCADCLENYIGEDIMSRLAEDAILLRFSGEDYRRKARKA